MLRCPPAAFFVEGEGALRASSWILLASAALATSPAAAVTGDTARIIDEGMNHSQVMLNAHELFDDIGPRLTNSTNMRKAQDWAVRKLTSYGLSNVHREAYDFGRGWDILHSSVRLVSPRPIDLVAIPVAWSPPTNGTLRAPVMIAPMNRVEQFAAYRGKLAGKIVLTSLPGTSDEPSEAAFKRLDSGDISKLDEYKIPHIDPDAQNGFIKRVQFARELDAFLASEGAVAQATMAYRDGKLVSGEGYQNQVGGSPKLPTVQIAAEDYRRIARMAKMGDNPVLEIDSDVRYLDDDTHGYNIIAEIPGTDPKAGYVMAGAHFDSWVAGDGAADNGAGTVAVMEAARILKAIGARPKRTIRFRCGPARSRACSARSTMSRNISRADRLQSPRMGSPITSSGAIPIRSRRFPATATSRPISTSTMAPGSCAASTPRGMKPLRRSFANGCHRSRAWGLVRSSRARQAARTTNSSSRSRFPASSSSRTRSTMRAGSIIQTSTRSII